ncbi:hypothetical protein [Paractinoplanes rishiriensis]|uniref:Uncharacterized protein n=1 Tax=Paractinoplanes rishiriensis TaxID=1050105 RepID=A0A919N2E6_9ACTN|nr:hypothetical protein [Actinoplanes rishiriensis]GIE99727.1 hypothetical protein Ari01nite_71920 [Actinoplanes rishiriensis]
MAAHDPGSAPGSDSDSVQNPSQAWQELAADYERARAREDSLDRLVEWPAERDILGDVAGRSILDQTATEPQLTEDTARRYPHKQAWMNKYLGILIFKLRPVTG